MWLSESLVRRHTKFFLLFSILTVVEILLPVLAFKLTLGSTLIYENMYYQYQTRDENLFSTNIFANINNRLRLKLEFVDKKLEKSIFWMISRKRCTGSWVTQILNGTNKSSKKCQFGEVPVGGSASWGKY